MWLNEINYYLERKQRCNHKKHKEKSNKKI